MAETFLIAFEGRFQFVGSAGSSAALALWNRYQPSAEESPGGSEDAPGARTHGRPR